MSDITPSPDSLESVKEIHSKLEELVKKYGDRLFGYLEINGRYMFYATIHGQDATYCSEYGIKRPNSTAVIAYARKYYNRVEHLTTPDVTLRELDELVKFMPVIEKFAEVAAKPEEEY